MEPSTTSSSSLTTQSIPTTTATKIITTTTTMTKITTTMSTTTTTTVAAPTQTPKPSLHEPCRDGLCHNGGTCYQPQLPGVALPSCHCPLHFTGTFCEKGRSFLFFVDSLSQIFNADTHTHIKMLKNLLYCDLHSGIIKSQPTNYVG